MMMHHRDVLRLSEWKQMKKERYELANDLLESVLSGEASPGTSDYSYCNSEENSSSSSGSNDTRTQLRKRVRRTK